MSADPIVQRCILCNTGFTAEQIKGATCCPACGCRAIPLGPESDVTIRINLQELRVLCHWAEFHAKNVDHRELDNPLHQSLNDQVQAMALRIKAQLPPDKPG